MDTTSSCDGERWSRDLRPLFTRPVSLDPVRFIPHNNSSVGVPPVRPVKSRRHTRGSGISVKGETDSQVLVFLWGGV